MVPAPKKMGGSYRTFTSFTISYALVVNPSLSFVIALFYI
jgi:hypothetical protein